MADGRWQRAEGRPRWGRSAPHGARAASRDEWQMAESGRRTQVGAVGAAWGGKRGVTEGPRSGGAGSRELGAWPAARAGADVRSRSSDIGHEVTGQQGRPISVICHLASAICHLPSGLLARPGGDPLSHPLVGQYPGRSGVSRPSSEWGRVGPPRCDHQVEPGAGAQGQACRSDHAAQAARLRAL